MRATCIACLVFLAVIVPVTRGKLEAIPLSDPLEASAGSSPAVIVDVQALPQPSPCGICGRRNVFGLGLSPINVVFPCHYQSTDAPY